MGKTVYEMAKEYYPKLWNLERMKSLVKNNKLSTEDYEKITGEKI